jgi:4-amino-4-deoxy-L-arabinose transferase-like glycosyltransferase
MGLGRFKWALLAFTVLGFAVRFGCLEIAAPVRITGDEVYFSKVAINIANGNGHTDNDGSRVSWPPGNSYFLSLFVDPEKPQEGAAGLAYTIKMMMVGQVFLGSLLIPLVMLLALELFDRRTAVVAGAITAFYPTFVAYSHYLWAENAFLVPVIAGLILTIRTHRSGSYTLAAICGLLFGFAALSRETGLVIAAACGLWFVWTAAKDDRKPALLRAGLMVLASILVIVPWTIRNYRVTGGFIPIATISWMAMAEGNIFAPDDWLHPNRDVLIGYRTAWRNIPDEVERMRFSRRVAIAQMKKEQPTWILKKLVRTSGLLFSPDSFLFKKISRGAYGNLSMTTIRLLLILTVSSYLFVALNGFLGILISPQRMHRLLPLVVVGSVFLLHVAAFTSSRHRLPIIALLIPYASYGVLNWQALPRLFAGRRWIIPAVILVWFFTLCVPYFFDDAVSLWARGTYVNPWRP